MTGSGPASGAARVLVLIGWPISLAAVALAALAADRLLASSPPPRLRRGVIVAAIVTVLLCATIAWPGVITQSNLDAKASNGLAAAGVVLAIALTAFALRRCGPGPRATRGRGDWVALAVAAVFALAALPWIFANAGVYVGDIPVLKAVFMSKKILPEPGHPHLHAVHLGNHEGLDGWLLAVTAILLRPALAQMRPTRLRPVLGAYLALLLGYGVLVAANDGWNEQLVKRGWTSYRPARRDHPQHLVGVGRPAADHGRPFPDRLPRATDPLGGDRGGVVGAVINPAARVSSFRPRCREPSS